MELTFIANAIRRYYWVVLVAVVVGVLPGLLHGEEPIRYESRSVVLLTPPVDLAGNTSSAPNRYVNGQISVLTSVSLADTVSEALGDDISTASISNAVRLTHELDTDVVELLVTTTSPRRSQEIGEAYLESYFTALRVQVENAQAPQLETLNQEIGVLTAERDRVNDEAAAATAPFLNSPNPPDLEFVDPGLESERADISNQLAAKRELLAGLQSTALRRVSSEIVQQPTLPDAPLAGAPNLLLFAGLFGGVALGLVAAIVLARISPLVLGDDQAEEILGHAVVGTLPKLAVAKTDRRRLLTELVEDRGDAVESLCVRIEASAAEGSGLTVLVTGTSRGVGATTVAAVVARRFAERDSRVLLVDADRRSGELTQLFEDAPQAEREASDTVGDSERGGRSIGPTATEVVTSVPTDLANLHVTSFTKLSGSNAIHSRDVADVVAAANIWAEVVIFDGGALLDAGSTVRLARLCDVVVLAMPRNQEIRPLGDVADELSDHATLAMWTPVRSTGGLFGRLRSRR